MPYLYASNVSPSDRFTQIELQRDDGSVVVLAQGKSYDLTQTERARVAAYVVLASTAGAPTADPVVVDRLPINGTLHDGDVPVWSASLGAFVPETLSGGGITKWKDPVSTRAALDSIASPDVGEARLVIADETIGDSLAIYGWDGTAWQLAAGGGTGGTSMSILSGTIAPDNATGGDGDYYLRHTGTELLIYGPKAAGAWPSGTSLIKRATVAEEGTPLALEDTLNFTGAGVTATDNSGAGRTDVAIPGLGVADEGSALTRRGTLNFTGAGVQAVDNSGSSRTDVTISGQIYSAITDTPEAHGAKRDGKMLTDATIAAGSLSTLTSASAPFVSTDTGKTIHVRNAGSGTNVGLTTTITYVNATTITLAVAATNAVTGQVAVFGTDDTAAWKAAAAAAVSACQADGSYYAEVVGSNGIYMIAGAPTLGGGTPDTMGNAQIPLPPVNPFTAGNSKVTLRLGGAHDSATVAHWDQRQPQMSGCVLFSTLMAQTSHGTYGLPSVIGGPTVDVGSSPAETFSNMKLILDGLYVVCPFNPTYLGVDARRLAQCDVLNLTCQGLAGPDTDAGTPNFATKPTSTNGIGLYMPRMNNNDSANIGVYHCEGFYYGVAFSDHFTAQKLLLVYCDTAMFINNPSSTPQHGGSILYASVEACNCVIETTAGLGAWFPLTADLIDLEIIAGQYDIKDANNSLRGEIGWTDPPAKRAPRINGGRHLKVVDVMAPRGAFNVAVSNVSNVATATVTTSTAHGLTTGQGVWINGVGGATGINGYWPVTVVSTTTFTVPNTATPGVYTSGGTVTLTAGPPALGGGSATITTTTNAIGALVTTSAAHGLAVGQQVVISGVATAFQMNGSWIVATVPSTTTFTINNVLSPGATGSGGTVTAAYVPWRDQMVTIAGGTITGVLIDGQSTGLTSGAFVLPSGKALTLTGTVAPTTFVSYGI